ncbi:AAA domain-containing protein [Kribbella sp. NBC_01505]|uniref:AAA domain-containing protein n=1 Tax=Kribbella sp. NBC_01505 TaxID=2903580 RepID=UPI00386557BA
MAWSDEVTTALEEWIALEGGSARRPSWRRVGRAMRTANDGEYLVDVRSSELGPDQLDDLKLAGPERTSIDSGHAVMEVSQSGTALTVRVAEFAHPEDPHLWLLQQPTTFLIEALRDGLANLGDAPLAASLADGKVQGRPASAVAQPGLLPAQMETYRACLGSGLFLVWGPPGTGKTMVLKRAIVDLLAAGKRILLVSGTNIAVDNALLGVLREGAHAAGEILRVGPPQLREVAADATVSLPLLVRDRLTATEVKRQAISDELVAIQERVDRLAAVEKELTGFDVARYVAARRLLARHDDDLSGVNAAVLNAETAYRRRTGDVEAAAHEVQQARQQLDEVADSRHLWTQVQQLRAEADQVDGAATTVEAAALIADQERADLQLRLGELGRLAGISKWRARKELATTAERLRAAVEGQTRLAAKALSARDVADRRSRVLLDQAQAIATGIPFSSEVIRDREDRARAAAPELQRLTRIKEETLSELRLAVERQTAAHRADEIVRSEKAAGRPVLHDQAGPLRRRVQVDRSRSVELEAQYQAVQEEFERLARDAEGEIVAAARLVATTLARSRTNKHVLNGRYDVVLVDEVGAATLPEVLLAVSRASSTAVLLGDFLQLGPVLPSAIKQSKRREIVTWLQADVFAHCGIGTPAEARAHPSCVTLTAQNRFGHTVMELANGIAYDGALEAGPLVPARDVVADPEIVLIDTDGLGELAVPTRTGAASGWWPAGALLARALIELHEDNGEATGVVTPYRHQASATLEALRDVERTGGPLAEVGTAHRFQGREFPIVVFDLVEGSDGKAMWMAQAGRGPGTSGWQQDGLRLFNVAITRVRTRLYLLGSRGRIEAAAPGTAFAELKGRINRTVPGTALIAPRATADSERLGPFGSRLRDVLGRHVEITDIDDEREFFETFIEAIRTARASLWIWAPWVVNRVRQLLPHLAAAAARGVRIVVFVRDPSDPIQRANAELVTDLRAVVHAATLVERMHQKIIVVDEQTVLIGSLNALSQSRTREIMVTIRGAHFARKILEHEHAEVFADPPTCPKCTRTDVDLRRRRNGIWYWRCFNSTCPGRTGRRAWNQDIVFSRKP